MSTINIESVEVQQSPVFTTQEAEMLWTAAEERDNANHAAKAAEAAADNAVKVEEVLTQALEDLDKATAAKQLAESRFEKLNASKQKAAEKLNHRLLARDWEEVSSLLQEHQDALELLAEWSAVAYSLQLEVCFNRNYLASLRVNAAAEARLETLLQVVEDWEEDTFEW